MVATPPTGRDPSPMRSRLEESLGRMADWREAAGYDSVSYRTVLGPFIRYVGERWPDATALTAEMLDCWLSHHAYPSPNSQGAFVTCLRGFCRYLRFEGADDFVPGPEYSLDEIRYQPYLFTDDELSALFAAIDSYKGRNSGKVMLPELVLPVWARLLYCCGMRPGEPPSLLRADVDLETGDVYIRQSKGHKDRHIIVSDDMRELMGRYDGLCPRDRTWFFERWDGKPYTTRWFGALWRKIRSSCGVEWRGGNKPRPYDLRHAMASRALVRWMDEGNDAMSLMPVLSAYLGHSELEHTLYYIHLLPERLRRSPGVDWDYLSGIYGDGDGDGT